MVTWYLLPHNHFSLLLGHFNGSSLLPPRSCYTIPMLLPDSPEELLPSSVIPGMLDNRKISRAVIDNAIMQYMLPRLQPLLDRADSLAHSAESEGVALDATKYLIDRIGDFFPFACIYKPFTAMPLPLRCTSKLWRAMRVLSFPGLR